MRIGDLDKLNLFLPKIIDANEGLAFKDVEQNNSIFISDNITFTSLLSDYLNKFKFSKKFNKKVHLNKYIRTTKFTLSRDLVKSRSHIMKARGILETDIELSDFYDLSLENISNRKSYGYTQSIKKMNKVLENDYFVHNKNNINLFWLISTPLLDANNSEEYDINHSTIMLSRIYKDFVLDPNNNKNIKSMYIMIPFDVEQDKQSVDLKFYLVKVYQKGLEELNYTKIKNVITKSISNAEKLAKKKLFECDLNNGSTTEVSNIDPTYKVYNENDLTLKYDSNKDKPNKSQDLHEKNFDATIEEIPVNTKNSSQIKSVHFDQLKQTYMNKNYKPEIKDLFELSIKNYIPTISVKNHKIEDSSDGITEQELHTFTLYDDDHKKEKTISINLPKLIDDKFFKIYDKKYILSNQVYSNLVNKIKDDTVAFTSAYTKTIIYTQGKMDDKLGKYLSKIESGESVNPYIVSENKDMPNSLHAIFKYCTKFNYKDYIISYDIYRANFIFENENERLHPKRIVIGIKKEYYPNKAFLEDKDKLHNYIKEIYSKYGKESVLVYNCSIDSINNKPFLLEMKTHLEKFDSSIKKMPIPGSSQFARMNIAGKKVPVLICMLIYYNTFNPSNKLDEFFYEYFKDNVHIEVVDKPIHVDNVISIKLKDAYINIFLYESLIGSELLFSILRKIDMTKYTLEDVTHNNDIKLLLYSYFESQKLQPDTAIESISNGIVSILDPITKKMIEESEYEYPLGDGIVKPKDIVEILYYCVFLLNDRTYKSGNDFSGYRIRNMETIPAIIYKLMSKEAASAKKIADSRVKNRKKPIDSISIHKDAVMEEFRNLTTFESFSDLNISNEIGLVSKVTYKGFGGLNNNRSISYDLRATDPSSIGFVDVGNNVDNLNVGSNRMLPFNPNIKDVRGSKERIKNLREKVMTDKVLTDEETSSMLSFDTYNEPFIAAHSDAPRISMASIQARHGVPLDSYSDLPIKTGLEDSIKQVVSSSFVIKSPKENGPFKVSDIDNEKKEIILIDKNNKKHNISYADKVVNNSGGGFHHLKTFSPCVKKNDKIDNNAPIALDNGSFINGNYSNAKILRTTLLHFGETLEDGAIISESAAKELVFNYVTEKEILIRSDQTIIKMIDKIGTDVDVGTPLLIFTKDSDIDDSVNNIFSDLNKELEKDDGLGLNSYIKSKYPGKIVDIKIQYNGKLRNIKSLNDCIKKLPKENVEEIKTNRIAGEIADDAILIKYYILTKIPAMSGSKSTAQSTKSVFVVWPDDKMPRTLDGERIDYIFSTFSIISRMTINNFTNLYLNKCIMELRKQLKQSLK